jgi:hypothetical protein
VRPLAHVVLGLGFGCAFLPLLTLAMADVPAADAGTGSAIVNLSMQLAAAVAVAVLLATMQYRTRALVAHGVSLADATVHGYRFAYAVAVVGVVGGLTIAALLLARPRRADRTLP